MWRRPPSCPAHSSRASAGTSTASSSRAASPFQPAASSTPSSASPRRAQELLAEVQLDVSLSCGVAVAARGTDEPATLLKAADTAQYVAKRRGGSRVYTAAQVAEENKTSPLTAGRHGTAGERIIAATAQLVHRLDGDLLEAPVLDRLEAVAAAYADATDFARWAISYAGPGRSYLRDLSLGENRSRDATGVRVAAGFEDYGQYELDDFPTTARVIAAGSGSFTAHVDDESSDPSERDFLDREGFKAIVGAAAGDDDGVYLVELVTDKDDAPMAELEAALRLAVRSAMPPKPHRRTKSKLTTGHSRALELTLSLADQLATASTEQEVCKAAVDKIDRAFNCAVVHVVAIEGGKLRDAGRELRHADAAELDPEHPGRDPRPLHRREGSRSWFPR